MKEIIIQIKLSPFKMLYIFTKIALLSYFKTVRRDLETFLECFRVEFAPKTYNLSYFLSNSK